MINGEFGLHWSRMRSHPLTILVALLMVAISVACSDAAPDGGAVATVLPTKTAASTPEQPPAEVGSTPGPDLTAKAGPEPTPVPTVALTDPAQTKSSPEDAAPNEAVAAAGEEVFSLVTQLVAELGHREAGTVEELRAEEHLRARFNEFGYSSELQEFTFEYFDLIGYIQGQQELASVVVLSPVQTSLPGIPLSTAPNGADNSGLLTLVDLEYGVQFADAGLNGKVAFIQPAEMFLSGGDVAQDLQNLANQAADAGAVAAVLSGASIGLATYRPLLAVESPIPALLLFPGAEMPLLQRLEVGEVTVSVSIQTEEMQSQNVVAELKGEGDDVVIVGAHYDVAPQTQSGPNDNTSGTATVLLLAKVLADQSLPFTVKFILFGAEETGLYGSSQYVSSLRNLELGRIKGMVNFDVVGTGPFIAMIGNSELVEFALGEAETLEIKAEEGVLPPGASSDHHSFEQVGVPVLMLYVPDISRIHTPNDKLEFVQSERLGEAFLLAEAILLSTEFP